MTLMAAVVALALGLASSVRSDMAYALHAMDGGRAKVLATPCTSTQRSCPRTPMSLCAAHRCFRAWSVRGWLFGAEIRRFPLAGQRNVFVQVPADSLRDPRTSANTEFAGRMVTFGELGGRFRVVREFLAQRLAMPVTCRDLPGRGRGSPRQPRLVAVLRRLLPGGGRPQRLALLTLVPPPPPRGPAAASSGEPSLKNALAFTKFSQAPHHASPKNKYSSAPSARNGPNGNFMCPQ